MKLWRISNFASLDGAGGVLFPGRWHSAGRPIVYTAETPAGAILEILAHIDREDLPQSYQLIEIDADPALAYESVSLDALRENWREQHAITRSIGDEWLASNRTLLLGVPSALAPHTWNYLINPRHEYFRQLRIVGIERYPMDGRIAGQ